MGSITSKIADDIGDYEMLCGRYGESVHYQNGYADCYGEHAAELEWKRVLDRRAEKDLTYNYLELCERFKVKPKTISGTRFEVEGWHAEELEDRARREDGKKPRRAVDLSRRAKVYTPREEFLIHRPPKDRFDRVLRSED